MQEKYSDETKRNRGRERSHQKREKKQRILKKLRDFLFTEEVCDQGVLYFHSFIGGGSDEDTYICVCIYTRWEKIVGKMQRFGMGEGDEVSGWLVFRILI